MPLSDKLLLGEEMNFLGLRSQSTAALPPQALPPPLQPEPNNRKPLEDLVAEDPFPLASLVETFDGRVGGGIVSENGTFAKNGAPPVVDKHIDVCKEEGWITIPCSTPSPSLLLLYKFFYQAQLCT